MTFRLQDLARLPTNTTRRLLSRFARLIHSSPPNSTPPGIPFSGDFACWQDAVSAGGSYDSDTIFEKTATSIMAVKNGTGLYERDSVIFYEHDPLFPWPLLSNLLWCTTRHDGNLSVFDFGGAIGSTYFQCKPFLSSINNLSWTVIDQPKQVAFGKANLTTDSLHFSESLDEFSSLPENAILIISSVLQYLPEPITTLERLLQKGFRYVILDRTPLRNATCDRLTIQHVPSSIYDAVYPAWFFGKSKLLRHFDCDYELVSSWLSGDRYVLDGELIMPEGACFSRTKAPNPAPQNTTR